MTWPEAAICKRLSAIEIVVFTLREHEQAAWAVHACNNDPARITTVRVLQQLTKLNVNMLINLMASSKNSLHKRLQM